ATRRDRSSCHRDRRQVWARWSCLLAGGARADLVPPELLLSKLDCRVTRSRDSTCGSPALDGSGRDVRGGLRGSELLERPGMGRTSTTAVARMCGHCGLLR